MRIRYLSLFSGIEACTVAWETLGWEPVAFAQYEPGDRIQFTSQVLKYHYPDVPNLGDVTKITEEQIRALGHIDLVVGGSPCQDLSLAGKRASLRNEDGSLTRSGLFDYQLQIFEWARRNNGCRWLLWENVVGAFSSGKEVKGSDFAYILGSMVQRDVPVPGDGWCTSGIVTSSDWSRIVEWRVLDAQYFRGSPQRRRRVFALLDSGPWWKRNPVLFESGCCERVPEKGEGKEQTASTKVAGCSGKDGVDDFRLIAEDTKEFEMESICYENHPSDSRVNNIFDDVSPTLTTRPMNLPLVRDNFKGYRYIRTYTPEECEKLDGFPVGYTDVPCECSERAKTEFRFAALGNSMAVPVMRWIGSRIVEVLGNPITEDTSEPMYWQPELF